MLNGPAGWWIDERDPLRHLMADLRSEKLNLHLRQCMVQLYGLSYLVAMRVAILL